MYKKVIASIAALTVALGAAAAPVEEIGAGLLVPEITASAASTYGDFLYEYVATESSAIAVTITGYTGTSGEVTIPSSINGYPVQFIEGGFSSNNSIKKITIPDSVTAITAGAFKDDTNLTEVKLSKKLLEIKAQTFSGCSSLKSIAIPSSVKAIGDDAFARCSSLASVSIPNTVTSIGSTAFVYCTSLTAVSLPSSLTKLDQGAFSACSALKSITIPSKVTKISRDTFSTCTSLASITIPASVTEIDTYAFSSCRSLKNVYYGSTKAKWQTVTVRSGNDYLLNANIHFTAATAKKSIAKATVKLSKTKVAYTGKARKPGVTVKLGGATLKNRTDYTVTYKNNTKTGKATVTIKGKGKYSGSVSKSFIIVPKKPAKPAAKALGKQKIKVTVKKTKLASGYRIQCSTSKKFTKKTTKTVTLAKYTNNTKTFAKLTKGKTYYVRSCSYIKVGTKKYYGEYSAVKKVKCK